MIASLYDIVCAKDKAAADDVLLEVVRLGDEDEQAAAVGGLIKRRRDAGLIGLLMNFDSLAPAAREVAMKASDVLAPAVGKAARNGSDRAGRGAASFIAATRDPKLVGTLVSLLKSTQTTVHTAAAEGVVALCDSLGVRGDADPELVKALSQAVTDALTDPRGRASGAAERHLVRAAVLLVAAGSKYEGLSKLIRARGRGSAVLDAVERPTDAASGAAAVRLHRRVRGTLPAALRSVEKPDAVAGLVDQAHLLADPITAAAAEDIGRDEPAGQDRWDELAFRLRDDAAPEAARRERDLLRWAAQGADDAELSSLIRRLPLTGPGESASKLCLLRAMADRPDGAPLSVLETMAGDPDERVARMALRQMGRRVRGSVRSIGPAAGSGSIGASQQLERAFLRACSRAPKSVRASAAATLGRSFDAFWRKCDSLTPAARVAAGQALAKLLPDLPQRLARLAGSGATASRSKALQLASDLSLAPAIADAVVAGCRDSDPRLRSKAAHVLADVLRDDSAKPNAWSTLDAVLEDPDARVRANAVETLSLLGGRRSGDEVKRLLEVRAKLGRNRERANALVALSTLRLADVEPPLFDMLRDRRDAHRLSAVWAVGETKRWRLLDEVVRIARTDENANLRQSAQAAVRKIATRMRPAARVTPGSTGKLAAGLAAGAGLWITSPAIAQENRLSEISAAFAGRSNDAGETVTADAAAGGVWLAGVIMLVSGGAAITMIATRLRRWQRRRSDSRAAIGRELCRRLGFSRKVRRTLDDMAEAAGASVATLLLCPSLLQRVAEASGGGETRMVAKLVLRRLV